MTIKLNKESYQLIIDEDISELKKSMEDTLVRKHIIAVLDNNGHEVVIFPKGQEEMAKEYSMFLNKKNNVFTGSEIYLLLLLCNEKKETINEDTLLYHELGHIIEILNILNNECK